MEKNTDKLPANGVVQEDVDNTAPNELASKTARVAAAEAFRAKLGKRKQVTKSVLRTEVGVPIFVKVISEKYQAEPLANAKKDDKKPPMMVNVIDLQTGLEAMVILNKVLESELDRSFPKGTYNGKCLEITKRKPEKDVEYFVFDIMEFDDPTK